MSQQINQILNDLTKKLQEQGINVVDAAVLKLGDQQKGSDADLEKAVIKAAFERLSAKKAPKSIQEVLENMKKDIEAKTNKGSQVDDEPCWCPDCFRWDNFEQVLNTKPDANFGYASFNVSGKNFDVKFYEGPYGEKMMIQLHEFTVDPTWTNEFLIAKLNDAIAQKEFDKAQILLNTLNNRKTN